MSSKLKTATKGEYIETETGNKISRLAQVQGAKHIVLAGKCVIQQGTVVRGDLIRQQTPQKPSDSLDPKSVAAKKPSQPSSIHLGRYVFVSEKCTLHPPSRLDLTKDSGGNETKQLTYYPLRISDYVYIGPNSNIRAAEIKSHVHVGASVTIGNFAVVKENVKILDGAVLPANSIWASGSVIAGSPARVVGEMPEAWSSTSGGTTSAGDEIVGVRCRERWAAVGSKR